MDIRQPCDRATESAFLEGQAKAWDPNTRKQSALLIASHRGEVATRGSVSEYLNYGATQCFYSYFYIRFPSERYPRWHLKTDRHAICTFNGRGLYVNASRWPRNSEWRYSSTGSQNGWTGQASFGFGYMK